MICSVSVVLRVVFKFLFIYCNIYQLVFDRVGVLHFGYRGRLKPLKEHKTERLNGSLSSSSFFFSSRT